MIKPSFDKLATKKISGELLTDQEDHLLGQYLHSSEAYRARYKQYKAIYCLLNPTVQSEKGNLEFLMRTFLKKHAQRKRRNLYRGIAGIVAAGLLLFYLTQLWFYKKETLASFDIIMLEEPGIAIDTKTYKLTDSLLHRIFGIRQTETSIHFEGLNYQKRITVKVPKGFRRQITLPDGSTALLNSDSQLRFPSKFNTSERALYMSGEIFFDVQHQAERPFVVQSASMKVRVVGTRFAIREYSHDDPVKHTTLLDGKVMIKRENKNIILQPGQQFLIEGKQETVKNVDAEKQLLWRNNILYFDRNSFAEIIKTLERWYNVRIICLDESLKQQVFSGEFENVSIEELLKIFQMNTAFNYKIKGKTIYINN